MPPAPRLYARVRVAWPKRPLLNALVGGPKLTWLNTLNDSTRSWRFTPPERDIAVDGEVELAHAETAKRIASSVP